ncbi:MULTISPECIES: Flp family type IVb pilin [unclassified Bradyrhizobium]|uniref:Flp family type IVb pilin n=1 Tax=unclassified Bradyrhizobium TaxID=2631580 RepID=UPI0039648A66
MRKFATKVAGWLSVKSESGVTAIEYGLLAALIAVVIIVGVTLIGTNLEAIFNYIGGKTKAPCTEKFPPATLEPSRCVAYQDAKQLG